MPLPLLFRRVALGVTLFGASAVFAQTGRYESVVFNEVDLTSDVVFRTAKSFQGKDETLKLDVYKPASDTERRRPAILWIHGGGFRPPNDKQQKYIVAMATAFAKRGYVCVSADYRVRAEQEADRMPILRDAVEDCRAALAWMKSHAAELGIDPQRLAVGGGSAGGMVAVSLVALENAEAARNRTTPLFALINLWGSPKDGFMMGDVDKSYPPTVIVHGTADQSVPFAQSETLVARLKAAGIRHELLPIPGAPHTPTAHLEAIVKTTAAFVAAALPR